MAERLLIGQWALLLGYAGLPWVLREVCTGRSGSGRRLVLVMLPAAIGGFAALIVTGLAAVPASLARGSGAERFRRLAAVIAVLALLSLPWLIPSLMVPVHTDPLGADLFAARADTPFGRLGSLVMLSGIWNSQTVPRGYGGAGSFFWLLVVACALACYVVVARRQRGWTGLGLAGLIGLGIAAIGVTSPTRAMLHGLIAAWPGFAVLRDGQQFVAALALMEAVGLGAGVAMATARRSAAQSPDTRGGRAKRSLPLSRSRCWRCWRLSCWCPGWPGASRAAPAGAVSGGLAGGEADHRRQRAARKRAGPAVGGVSPLLLEPRRGRLRPLEQAAVA